MSFRGRLILGVAAIEGVFLALLVGSALELMHHAARVGRFADGFAPLVAVGALRLGLVAAALVALSAAISGLLGAHLTRQLSDIRRAAAAVARGEFDVRLAERGPSDLRAVARAVNAMSAEIAQLQGDLRRQLADRTRTLNSTFAHLTQGVAIFDADGRLVASNAAMAEMFAMPPGFLAPGVRLDDLVDFHQSQQPASDSDEAARMEAACRERRWRGPTFAFELPFPDGRCIKVERTRLPDGGFIGTHQDVTSEREQQRKVLHAAKLATLGELATATAHELNQPLNVIRLAADNARSRLEAGRATDEFLAAKLERISDQTARAAAIIDHMRVFGRKPVDPPRLFDIGDSVRSAADFFTETARLQGVELSVAAPSGLIATGHPVLIEQVVANLLSNAVAAFGGPSAGAQRLVRIEVAPLGRHEVRVEVCDNAGGIPDHILPRLFEPFFTTKPSGQGTGLGLSISYGIISDMGGRLEARNVDGGAQFRFDLPLAEAASGGRSDRLTEEITA